MIQWNPMLKEAKKNFWGVSAAALGTYELAAITTKAVPTVSSYCARRKLRRAAVVGWALGLSYHLFMHQVEIK